MQCEFYVVSPMGFCSLYSRVFMPLSFESHTTSPTVCCTKPSIARHVSAGVMAYECDPGGHMVADMDTSSGHARPTEKRCPVDDGRRGLPEAAV
jgi:hypothetical protein